MWEQLLDTLGNSHFEAYVAGPALGVIFGVIFNALGKPPGPDEANRSPDDVRQDIKEKRQSRSGTRDVHHHHHHHYDRSSGDDGAAPIVIVGLIMVVALFLFALYLPQIAGSLYFFNTTVAMCCITAAVLALLTGRFNTSEWWLHAIFPAAISLGCFWLTVRARNEISSDVIAYAQSLIANEPMNIGVVLSAAFKFFKSLGNDYTQWLMFDMVAFICIIVCGVMALLRFVYYISLSNARESSRGLWAALALQTERFSGTGSVVFVLILFALGTSLATGQVYQWTHPTV
ncbi:hypothetical protein [Paraburkholderia flava]|uniref:hypothetical protein n=1 Tax=Paraburkholderia flava TaxID=2547393 RepID=UPI001F11242A|nr:hypothetical protein [Paraburkholderia flava]